MLNSPAAKQVALLRIAKVRLIGFTSDKPEDIVDKTIKEQQREIERFLYNRSLSQEQHTQLQLYKTAFEGELSFEKIIEIDKYLNALNMALISPQLNNIRNKTQHDPEAEIELLFNHCGLTRLPNALVEELLTFKVVSLNLEHNYLAYLPENIGRFRDLTSIKAAHNELSFLPESIGELELIIQIDLDHNRITFLPASIGGLRLLEIFTIKNNLLRALPNEIGGLSSLREFNASYNNIEEIPGSFVNLKSLARLYLNNNQLVHLPDFNCLKALFIIEISNNQFITAPSPSITTAFKNMSLSVTDVTTTTDPTAENPKVLRVHAASPT